MVAFRKRASVLENHRRKLEFKDMGIDPGKRTVQIVLKVLFYVMMAVLCVIFLFPVFWMLMNSFKTSEEVYATMNSWATFLPGNITHWLDSYIKMFSIMPEFGRAVFNSFLYCAIEIIGMLVLNSLAAYALSRFTFPGSNAIVTIIILLLIVPVETSIVPTIVILQSFGFLETNVGRVLGYLIPGFVSPMYIFMFRSYFMGIPKELEEAAYIDGCGRLKTFFVVIMPCCKPVFATVAIFAFMGQWNEYVFSQYLFASCKDYMPLQAYLQQVMNYSEYGVRDIAMTMSALTFSTIPIAIVYIFCQRYIVEGVAFSGLK